jgi:hypothetical protein
VDVQGNDAFEILERFEENNFYVRHENINIVLGIGRAGGGELYLHDLGYSYYATADCSGTVYTDPQHKYQDFGVLGPRELPAGTVVRMTGFNISADGFIVARRSFGRACSEWNPERLTHVRVLEVMGRLNNVGPWRFDQYRYFAE